MDSLSRPKIDSDLYYYQSIQKEFLTPHECNVIREELFKHEEEVLSIPQEKLHDQDYEGLTRQHRVFNWLTNPRISRLVLPNKLFQIEPFNTWDSAYIQCRGNILRQGEKLQEHCHRGDDSNWVYSHDTKEIPTENIQMAVNIFISGHTDTGTTIEGKKHENSIGEVTVFGECVLHEVKTNFHQQPRVSMAFDLYNQDYPSNTKEDQKLKNQPWRFIHFSNPFIKQTP